QVSKKDKQKVNFFFSLARSVVNPHVNGLAVPHPCSHRFRQQREQYLPKSTPCLGLPNPVRRQRRGYL
uniref:Uncharacterized protein n=1 Tax=Oryza meridionalis TaxID=40149 RepID=A0A0E0F187_9ORYZ